MHPSEQSPDLGVRHCEPFNMALPFQSPYPLLNAGIQQPLPPT